MNDAADVSPPGGPYRAHPRDEGRAWTRAASGLRLVLVVMALRFALGALGSVLTGYVRDHALNLSPWDLRVCALAMGGVTLAGFALTALLVVGFVLLVAAPRWTGVRGPAWWSAGIALASAGSTILFQVLQAMLARRRGPMIEYVQRVQVVMAARALTWSVLSCAALVALLVALSRARRAAGGRLPEWAWGLIALEVVSIVASYLLAVRLEWMALLYRMPTLRWVEAGARLSVGFVALALQLWLLASTRVLMLRAHDPGRLARGP